MADLRKLLDIVNESSTTAGSVATFAAGLSGTHKRVEEDKPEAPQVLEYGNWENSALTTSSKLKKERKKASKVVKSIYGEDSVEEAANSKQQAAIAVAKKKEVGEGKSKKQSTVMEYARTITRPDYRNNEKYKKYIDLRKEVQNLQMNGLAPKSYIMDLRGKLQTQKDELEKELGIKLGEDGVAKDSDQLYSTPVVEPKKQGVAEGSGQNLSVQQLATISDEALDKVYGYGRSSPGNTFGWQANLMSAAYAKKMIDAGVTDIEKISDAIHKGWNVTAQKFVQNPDQFDDTEKLRQAGKLEAKLQQRAKLMKINYAQLDNEEQEKDRVVARALLQAIKGQQGVAEGSLASRYSDDPAHPSFSTTTSSKNDPADSLESILALRKSNPSRAFRALQDYGFRNPKDPIIDAASKAGSAVKRQMLQKMGITDPRPGETPKEVIQAMHRAMFDYIEKNLPTQQGVAEGENIGGKRYEMMMRNGQVKKFVAKDDADAKRIAKGHGAKSVIKLKGNVPGAKILEQDVEEGLLGTALDKAKKVGKKVIDVVAPDDEELLRQLQRSMGIPASSQHGKKSMAEPADDKLDEADLIINPASMTKRPLGLLNKPQHPDHEVGMAKSDLYQASKNALAVFQMIRDIPEEVGIEGWVQEKIIKANDYLNTVREYLEGKQLESMDGVAASTKMFTSEGEMEEGKTGPGLWANIHAKRKRIKAGSGERMRKPGSKGAPKASDFRAARGGE